MRIHEVSLLSLRASRRRLCLTEFGRRIGGRRITCKKMYSAANFPINKPNGDRRSQRRQATIAAACSLSAIAVVDSVPTVIGIESLTSLKRNPSVTITT